MIVSTWKAASYGFKIPIADRNKFFDRNWNIAIIELPIENGFERVECNVNKASFWNDTCHELISAEIGEWLAAKGMDTWERGHPHKFELRHIEGNVFRIIEN